MNNPVAQHRIDFLGCPLDLLTPQELLEDARHALRGERRLRVEGLNVAKLVDARSTPVLARALNDAERVHIDGAGISLGLKVLGVPAPPRRAGIDFLGDLCALAAETGASVYLLGARRDVVALTADHLRARYPGLRIVGARDGYFRPEEEASVVESIRTSGADLLFIGMSSPKKELLLQKHWPELGVKIGMGVGGSFDVLSGKLPRAPRWVQVIGMEWFFRLVLEPRRLLWRYVRTNAAYFFLLTFAKLRSIAQRRAGSRRNA
ncbi:N-acetylglucosaminyldiphosphoundecaprenol N-acetyl-beta-D-mannosaminyltransferase [Pseudomonas asturiensis]|uniref:N-acetylglucosaminyldiphosphoundecaprenol N-acetyl-beta-D-mannosaminyltransferase n=1 Tax=Pseudomonas asturiensis TaxID=1190415 RepID=A0A1M7JTP4_9PSED|nr:WecB/TagA/CpsF family glycosyltransferase [Pseudomonas asturiensis]SHM56402.1 N-acetylglucosaminyldiphosphoundecaprenol N-acetyl-beta-D-mannosaminyltransferase [Pseudomonas asturiensis]